MNTITKRPNKKEVRQMRLNNHYTALACLAAKCGIDNPNGKKLSLALLKIEQPTRQLMVDYCNGKRDVFQNNEDIKKAFLQVQALFNNNLSGLFINNDARGTSLKINSDIMQTTYKDCGLTIDWGEDGMLCPEF